MISAMISEREITPQEKIGSKPMEKITEEQIGQINFFKFYFYVQ